MLFCIVGSIQTLLVCQSKKQEHFKAQWEGPDLAQSVWVKDAASDTVQIGCSALSAVHGAVAGSCKTSQGMLSASLSNQRREINTKALWMGTGGHQNELRVPEFGWREGDHRTELTFSFLKALTQRRMGRTNLRRTWTKRHKGIAFPSPWKSKIPAKGQEKNGWRGRDSRVSDRRGGHLIWQGNRGVQSSSSPGFHSELSQISCTNTVPHFPSGGQDASSLTLEIKKPNSA